LESPLFNIIVVTLQHEVSFKGPRDKISRAQLTADLKKSLGVKRLSVCTFSGSTAYIYFKAPLGVTVTLGFGSVLTPLLGLFRVNEVGSAQSNGSLPSKKEWYLSLSKRFYDIPSKVLQYVREHSPLKKQVLTGKNVFSAVSAFPWFIELVKKYDLKVTLRRLADVKYKRRSFYNSFPIKGVELSTHFLENLNKVGQESVYLESPLFNIIVVDLTHLMIESISKEQLTADLKKSLGVKRLSVCSFSATTHHTSVNIYFKVPLGVTLDFGRQNKFLFEGWTCCLGLFRVKVASAQIEG
jgi:hypothetical protein